MIVLWIVLPLVGCIVGWFIRWIYARFQLSSIEQRAERLQRDAAKEQEAKMREQVLEAKDGMLHERNEHNRDIQRRERRQLKREEALEEKIAAFEKEQKNTIDLARELENHEKEIATIRTRLQSELEHISGFTIEEAKNMIIASLEDEALHDAQSQMKKIEQEAVSQAERKAREILVSSIQRVASEVNAEVTVATVQLPTDDLKGRIIGREGRNIRTLETITGADIIIDDTPGAVLISCFDPIRKEIARRALERLILDGRIHPTRIEEVVQKVTNEINKYVYERGEAVLYELNITHMEAEGIQSLGRLYFRSSYGQNVLAHSKEVAVFAGIIASEIGANREIAKRGAILHDVGKGIESNSDSNHVELGVELAKRTGEDKRVINCIAAHHNDVPYSCVESVVVQIADALSASRPGARRETLDNYIQRLENLERIAEDFDGVEKAYAIQAGRELRIMVDHRRVDDQKAEDIAKQIARNIEAQLRYPGRIKVTLIRENRIVEYAR